MTVSSRPPAKRRHVRILVTATACLGVAVLLTWLLRAPLASLVLRSYLSGQGLRSHVVVDSIDLGGATAHGSVTQPGGFAVSFRRITLQFDPHSWLPKVAKISIVRPTIHLELLSPRAVPSSKKPKFAAGKSPPASTGGSASLVSGDLEIDVAQATIIAATQWGTVTIDGSARIAGGKPQWIDAVVKPARLHDGAVSAAIAGGTVKAATTPSGTHLALQLAGDAAWNGATPLRFRKLHIAVDVPALHWTMDAAAATAATVSLTADNAPAQPWSLSGRLSRLRFDFADGRSSGRAELQASGGLPAATAMQLVSEVPLLAKDRRTSAAWVTELGALRAGATLSWRTADGHTDLAIHSPAELRGADSLMLRLSPSVLHISATSLSGDLAAELSGPGVPQLAVTASDVTWNPQAAGATLSLVARAGFGSLREAQLDAQAAVTWRGGVLQATLPRCAQVRLGAYRLRGKPVVADVSGRLCAAPEQPLFRLAGGQWALQGQAIDVSAGAAALQVSGGGRFAITGAAAGPRDGSIEIAAGLTDKSKVARIGPERMTGSLRLTNGVAQGKFNLAAGHTRTSIGAVTVTYNVASGTGRAAIDFSDVAFTPQGLQPADLSPLLASVAQANGRARFIGSIAWTPRHIRSRGRLDIDELRFSSPLGAAEELCTHLIFTSLLPPETAPDQRIELARVDWMVPLTASVTDVSLTPSRIVIDDTKTDIANGEIALTPLSIDLTSGGAIHGTVRLAHVSLGTIIGASNLGNDLRLSGPISGTLPFTFGPAGLRFHGGHIAADGPGRLSISPGLWGSGEANSVQKAAYGALANLAYTSLSASVESQPHGRLRAVFKVSGYTDSPGPGPTEYKLSDLLSGGAFQKSIPVPRGTAVNLTLDTSLNFDELLRGYETAWSQVKAMR